MLFSIEIAASSSSPFLTSEMFALMIVPYPVDREMFEKRQFAMLRVHGVSAVDVTVMSGSVTIKTD